MPGPNFSLSFVNRTPTPEREIEQEFKEKKRSNIQAFNERRASTDSSTSNPKPRRKYKRRSNKDLLHPSRAETNGEHANPTKRRHNIDDESEVPDSADETTPANSSFGVPSLREQAGLPSHEDLREAHSAFPEKPSYSSPKLPSLKVNRQPSHIGSGSFGTFQINKEVNNSGFTPVPSRKNVNNNNSGSNPAPAYRRANGIKSAPIPISASKQQRKTTTTSPQTSGSETEDPIKKAAIWDERYPHSYFVYGTDASSYFLEKLCEDAAQRGDTIKVLESVELPKQDLEIKDSIIQRALRKQEKWSYEWRKQYKVVGLGKLTGYIWIVDENGEARILPTAVPAAPPPPARPTPSTGYQRGGHLLSMRVQPSKPSPKGPPNPKRYDTSRWRPEDWEAYYNPANPNKLVPTGAECSKWTTDVWQVYMNYPAAEQKAIPPLSYTEKWTEEMWIRYLFAPPATPGAKPAAASSSSAVKVSAGEKYKVVDQSGKLVEREVEKKKEDVVYGIIYRVSPALYTLLCNHQHSLLPPRTLRSLTISLQSRTPDSQPQDWYAPIEHVEDIKVNLFVGTGGLTTAEKGKKGRKAVFEDLAKKIAWNRAVLDLKALACPSVWIEENVRQYVPKPNNPYESAYWNRV